MSTLANILAATLGAISLSGVSYAIDLPSRFDTLDKNADKQISFSEFSVYTDTLGLTRTEAAQHFTRFSAGDAIITPQEWFLATQISESQSWKSGYALEPLEEEPTEVRPADIRAFEPVPSEDETPTSADTSIPLTEAESG